MALPSVFVWRKAAKTMKNKKTIVSVDNTESGDFLSSACTNIESDNTKSNRLNLETNTVIVNNATILVKTDEKMFIRGGHFF